jgi:hypothetical protein
LLQLTQVVQPSLQLAQLGVVQAGGGFLAVTGDEGHRGPAVEQVDSALHLGRAHAQLGGNLQQDRIQVSQAPAWGASAKKGAQCATVPNPRWTRKTSRNIASRHWEERTPVHGSKEGGAARR